MEIAPGIFMEKTETPGHRRFRTADGLLSIELGELDSVNLSIMIADLYYRLRRPAQAAGPTPTT